MAVLECDQANRQPTTRPNRRIVTPPRLTSEEIDERRALSLSAAEERSKEFRQGGVASNLKPRRDAWRASLERT
jgi:hypothetical protein